MTQRFTAADVLRFLERCLMENPTWSFIDLEHPYVYTANSRLTLYADETRWALVGEVSGYGPRAARFELKLHYFGNCLGQLRPAGDRNQYTYNMEFITLIAQQAMNETVDHFAATAQPVLVRVRDRDVLVPASAGTTFMPNVESRSWPADARAEDVGRYVAYEYAEICRATADEKRMRLPADIPELMTIDDWHHRSWYYSHAPSNPGPRGDAPGSYETYRLIAQVLATRDPSRYRPTLQPNNHWSNWPAAGSL